MSSNVLGAFRAAVPPTAYRLRQIEEGAQTSRAVADLLLGLARGDQPEHPFVTPAVPRWAAFAMEAR